MAPERASQQAFLGGFGAALRCQHSGNDRLVRVHVGDGRDADARRLDDVDGPDALAGETGAALEAVAQGLQILRTTEERRWEAELHRLHGELVLAQAGSGRSAARAQRSAEESFRRAIAIAQQQRAKVLELRSTASLARPGGFSLPR